MNEPVRRSRLEPMSSEDLLILTDRQAEDQAARVRNHDRARRRSAANNPRQTPEATGSTGPEDEPA